MSEAPDNRRYTPSHEWALHQDGLVIIGITAHAVQALSDLVFIDLPDPHSDVRSGESFGEIESVKAVSELNSPITGTVVEVNKDIEDNLDTIVESPYEDGWLIKVQPTDPAELDALLSAKDYLATLD